MLLSMRSCRGIPELMPPMAALFIVVLTVFTSAMAQSISAVSFDAGTCLSELSPQASQEVISSEQSDLVLAISDAYQYELRRTRLTRSLLKMRQMEDLRALASPSLRSKRATGVNDPRNEVSNSTGFGHLTVTEQLNHFLRNSKNTDLGEVRKLFDRLRAASKRGKSSQAQTIPSSISSFLGNVTNISFSTTSEAARTTISPITALSTTSITIRRTFPGYVDSQEGMESTTAGNLWSNYSDITTVSNARGTERGSLHPISVESRRSDQDMIVGDNSAETVEENNITLPSRTHSTPRPRGSSIFDQSHLNLLMGKLLPNNIEIESLRTIADDSVLERSTTSVNEEDFWHSYTYNTGVFNRERLTVRGVSSSPASSARPLSAVFQAPVAGSLFARDADGFLVAVGAGGVVHPLRPGLGWTDSTVGCPCTKAPEDGPRSCACCRHGGCLCSQQDRCGPCQSAGNRPQCTKTELFLSVDAVAALPSRRNKTIVVTAQFDSLSVLETDDHELSPLHLKAGQPNRLNPGVAITSLTIVEVPTRQACRVVRRSYILSHRASTGTLLAQEIVVDQQEKTYNLGVLYTWEAPGRKMKVLQTEERALVFVLKDSSVMVLELKAETSHDNFIHVLATLNVSYPVEHFHCFENLDNSYALMGGRDTAALYIIDDEEILLSQLLQASDFGLKAFDEILPLPSGNYRGDTALLATSGSTAAILTWQQRSFVLSTSFQTPGVAWSSGAVLQTRDATEVVHVAKDGHAAVISVQLSLKKERDPLSEQNDRLQRLVAGLKDRMTHHNYVLGEISNRLRRSVSLSSTIISGRIKMVGGVVVKSARAQRLNLTRVTVPTTSGLEQSLEEHQSLMKVEQQALLSAEARLNATEHQIEGGVLQNMEVATLSGHISFSSLSTSQLSASDLIMKGRILEHLVKDLVVTNGFHFISGTTTFISPLAPHSLRATSLDGVPVTDFVSENIDVTLGRVIYQNGLTVLGELLVTRGLTIGSVDVARAMTLSGRNYVDNCTFSEVDARKGLTATDNRVNGVDIVGLLNSVLNKTQSTAIEGSLMFTNAISVEGSVYAGTVMGVDIMNLFTTSVSKTAASTIQSTVTFKSRVELNSSVEVVGLINGRQFPSHYPSASSKSITFENKKFEEIAVQTMSVAGLVDGIRTRDLVTLSTDQLITGTKTFSAGIDVEGNLNISSALLDGVNLIDIQREAGKMKNDILTYSVVFEKRAVLHSLEVKGTVNNFNITEIAGDLLLANEKVGKISGSKVFAGNLLADHITFDEINGVRFDDFVNSERKSLVSGRKRFDKGFSCERLTVRGLTAGVNVTHLLASSLHVRKPDQAVSAKKFFTASIRASRVVVEKDVNGVNFSRDVAIRTANTSFQYEQILSSASFNEISAHHIQLKPSKLINEVDVSSLSDSAVYLDKDQILYESITCIGEVTFQSTLNAKYVNEIDLEEFIHNLVQKDEENTIVGNLQIKNVTVIGNLSTFNKEGINLFNVSELDLKAVKLYDELLDVSAVWQNISFDGDVLFGGLINGYDLVRLQQDAVFLDSSSPLHFPGWKTMSGEVVITGNLSSPSINGLDLERDVLTKSTNQIITAPYTFKTLTTDDLDVVGPFNGMNLSELVETRLGANMFLEGPVNFSEDISVNQLEVGGLVNDVSIRSIMADAIPINNGSTNITGKKIFARVPRFSSLHIQKLNGEDLPALVLDLVRSDEANHFSRDVTIVHVSAQLVVADTVTVQGHVDGVNSTELLADLIFLDQDERIPNTGTLKFANLQVGEETGQGELLVQSLNSRDTLTGYLLSDWPQVFNFSASFLSVTTGNVTGSGFVNGWDLDLFEHSLKVTGDQAMLGDVVFGNLHVTTSFNVSGTVGREDVALISSKDVVPLNQDSISVEGSLKFESAVRARDLWSSSNVVNDLDMDDMASQAWRTDRHSFISGNFTFSGLVYFESETILGLHELSSLSTMQREVGTIHSLVSKPIATYRGKYQEQCWKGSVLFELLSHGYEKPDHLLEVFNRSVPGHSLSPTPLVVQALNSTLVFMPQAYNSCSVAVHLWSGPVIGLQQWYNIEDVGEVADWTFLSGLPLALVAVAVRPSARCPGTASVILRVTADSIQATQEIKGLGNVTWDRSNSSLLLHVGSGTQPKSYSYAWNEERNTFIEVSTSLPDLIRFVSGKSHSIGWVRFAGGVLLVGEDSATIAEVIVADVVDADLVYQQTDLLVLLVTKQTVLDVVTFHFYVLRQSAVTDSMLVQDWRPLPSAASVSVLHHATPGDEARHLIVLATGSSSPTFFWLKGNGQLRPWALDVPSRNVSWVGHFASEGNLYLLMQDANSYFTISGIGTTGQRLDSRKRFPDCGLIE